MKNSLFLSTLLLSTLTWAATSQLDGEYQFANCKPITPEIGVLPGSNDQTKPSTLVAEKIKLSIVQTEKGSGMALRATVEGDVNGVQTTRVIQGDNTVSVGDSYKLYVYEASSKKDALRSIKMSTETLESDTQLIPTKVLLSIAAKSQAIINNKLSERTQLSNHICEVIKQ